MIIRDATPAALQRIASGILRMFLHSETIVRIPAVLSTPTLLPSSKNDGQIVIQPPSCTSDDPALFHPVLLHRGGVERRFAFKSKPEDTGKPDTLKEVKEYVNMTVAQLFHTTYMVHDLHYRPNTIANVLMYETLDRRGYWGDHAIGEGWAKMLWVMSQVLIEKYGYSDDLAPPQGREDVPEGELNSRLGGCSSSIMVTL
ncbi:hypothetical protein BKA70DRAFT_1522171 [Coprinopsis sp. MPI-PUGE-AT-0042]|nr:hypothetical protein BKA70DRAFT_1522171 [Coprinopsis sp. MPI-PUGE-AT-0042]